MLGRISLRKTGVHFSGKCSRSRSEKADQDSVRSMAGTRSRFDAWSHFLAENRCPLFREMLQREGLMKVTGIETLHCDAGWRNYNFVKLSTDEGIVGWSEFDEGFGSPGVGTVIEQLAGRVIGRPVSAHEHIHAELYCV